MKMKINSQFLLKLLYFLGAFGIIILLLNFLFFPWYVSSEVRTVPKVEGLNIIKAKQILSDAGLTPIVSDTMPQPRKEAGLVLNQRPKSGEQVKDGRRVHLVISGGAQRVLVPELIGKTINEAKVALEKVNLELGSIEIVEIKEDKDKILSQQYPTGSLQKEGTKVGISVSKGELPGTIEVPVLAGKLLSEAEVILSQINLKVGKINFQPSFQLAPNTIIDQYPPAGTKLNPGDQVELFVTKESQLRDETGEGF
ncbi:MAG: PASTA domain-containing protein [Ignavibacteriaceae bacterium]|nr:PASTA domain-containing protein [Ignavibacteriaceae bacterium]